MVELKIVISDPKIGKCVQKVIKDDDAKSLIGLKIGDTLKGESMGLAEYEFIITGGSDDCGFPMRSDLAGTKRKRILIVKGVGLRNKKKGLKRRKTVVGNTIDEKTAQVNVKVTKYGKEKLIVEKAEEKPAEEEKPKAEEAKK